MKRTFRIYRGDNQKGEYKDYEIEVQEGMVVLDAVHKIQAEQEPDLGVRWNCKAGKCGSCGAEVNGKPKLMCMCRISSLPGASKNSHNSQEPIHIAPMKAFPVIKDLACDVSWNYEQNKKIPPFTPAKDTTWKMQQHDVERAQEFRKCIECFLCQDSCHVLRSHKKHDEFFGPRFFVRTASLDMHPLDTLDRAKLLKEAGGIGYCNITKCCTEVCPEHIQITDNAIIPMKERVADQFHDPIKTFWNKFSKKKSHNN